MRWCRYLVVGLSILLAASTSPAARAQDPTPESLAAAKELIAVMHLKDQFAAVMPIIVKGMKSAIVQGRPEVDRQYDAMTPKLLEAFQSKASEFSDATAMIYARNFSAEDLKVLTAFYKTPAGQRFLQKMPLLAQESMAVGKQFGQAVGEEMKKRMIEDLRKSGVDL
ncbi:MULTISPECIES: DUF2059 domain-containing protein [unclassified Bradyrhizobium]|uniref:DUF2059 domain-containing protein n=2 Tax=unclassified Bradyrhizobium TaxID=2631580 RepID=UPI0028E843FB|nr:MULTISPECIES: DUF2059 domain-containing protein [unclassified Bradyrhizobium]